MARPRISDDLVEQITEHADALLANSPVDASELPFEKRLKIVFEAARDKSEPDGTAMDGPVQAGTDVVPDGTEGDHPGGDAAAEALLIDGL